MKHSWGLCLCLVVSAFYYAAGFLPAAARSGSGYRTAAAFVGSPTTTPSQQTNEYVDNPMWVSSLVQIVNSNNDCMGYGGSKVVPHMNLTLSSLAGALSTWEEALLNGVLPTASTVNWPERALLQEISATLLELEVPKLTLRHPDLVQPVLRGLIRLASEYNLKMKLMREEQQQKQLHLQEEAAGEDYENDELLKYVYENQEVCSDDETQHDFCYQMSDEEMEEITINLVIKNFVRLWAPPTQALDTLDSIYGPSHGLVDFQDDELSGGGGGGYGGFGLFDGVWQRSGWVEMKVFTTLFITSWKFCIGRTFSILLFLIKSK